MTIKNVTKKVKEHNENREKSDKELFIEEVTPYANEAAKELGIDPKVLIAQAGHETGWGKHVAKNADGTSSNNLFNIKTTKGWKGDSTKITTHEIENGKSVKQKASFRSYSSYKESFQDYTKFIKENKRYKKAVEAGAAGDSVGYVKEMAKAGYATDTSYASKVLKTAGSIGKGAVIAGAGVAVGAGAIMAGKAISKAIKPSVASVKNESPSMFKSIKSLFSSDKKEQEGESKSSDKTETSVISAKEKKKIATETEGLTPWQKKVIELLTKIANNSRKVTQTNENDTISVQQALIEKDETEIVKIPVEKESSSLKKLGTGLFIAGKIHTAYFLKQQYDKHSNTNPTVDKKTIKQPVKKNIEQPVKKSVEQPVKKTIKQPVAVDNKQTQEKSNTQTKQPIKEKFTKSVNSVVEKINTQKQPKEQPKTPIIVKQEQTKNIPKEKEIKVQQKTIVISETNNIEKETELSPVLLFGDRYSALDDLKSISLSNREYGTGLFRKNY